MGRNGRQPYSYAFSTHPESARQLKNIQLHHTLVQILTGHSRLNSFLYRIKAIQDPLCVYKTEAETVEHFHFGQIEFARVHMGMQTNCTLKTLMKSTKFRHSSTVGWSLFLKKEMNH